MRQFLSRQWVSSGGGDKPAGPAVDRATWGETSQTRARSGIWPRRWPAWMTVVLALLIGSAVWAVYSVTERSTRKIAENNVSSMLSAGVSALQLWLMDQRQITAGLIEDCEAQYPLGAALAATTAPVQSDDTPADALQAAKDVTQFLNEQITTRDEDIDCTGWLIVDADATIRLSSRPELIGRSFARLRPGLDTCFRYDSTVTPALPLPIHDGDASAAIHSRRDLAMIALSTIRDGVLPVGAFGLLLDPAHRFTEILSVARMGETGETYAFDSDGVMISQSRFDRQLHTLGLVDEASGANSVLRVTIRDPGLDLLHASPSDRQRIVQQWDQLPLTKMAAKAIDGRSGIDVNGYTDYRGVKVIGAWQWLDEYGFGVTTEMDHEEAYQAIDFLRLATWTLLAALALTVVSLAAVSLVFSRLYASTAAMRGAIRRLGQYELFEIIGRGGMGTVYRGQHQLLRRDVAIKVLERVDESDDIIPLADSRAVERFEREVQMTAKLGHPNTVNVYDYGRTAEGTFFYVMEHVGGMTVRQLIKADGRQSPGRVIHLLVQVCGSIQEAHHHGLIHRDIKPGNIVVVNFAGLYDMVKVLDFGLVRNLQRTDHTLTSPTALTGTPMYMAPEVIRNSKHADRSSDLYAIGAVGYQLLTGVTPYDATAVPEICAMRLGGDPERPADRIGCPLPDDLQDVLMDCLSHDIERRPATAGDLADRLRRCADVGSWTEDDSRQWWSRFGDAYDSASTPSGESAVVAQPGRPIRPMRDVWDSQSDAVTDPAASLMSGQWDDDEGRPPSASEPPRGGDNTAPTADDSRTFSYNPAEHGLVVDRQPDPAISPDSATTESTHGEDDQTKESG
ncbi:serine/threonine protein kinase [Crateriforma conspicua]|uniref:serine/threonine protein kinase n=1 Tax=Crateriforma conspicua TaxID=2527996 RepID=UPI001188EFAF|nr:serine/threonine-protein kinase [Crateriforma conspicua]QDV61448.1 Serine/threonine-protein kinase PrkC [Crateriforma conspicua]